MWQQLANQRYCLSSLRFLIHPVLSVPIIESFIFSGIWSLCAASPGNGSQWSANECQSAGFGNFTTDTLVWQTQATVNMHHSFWHRDKLRCHAPSDALKERFAFVVRIFMWSALRSDRLLDSLCQNVLSKLKVNVYQTVCWSVFVELS